MTGRVQCVVSHLPSVSGSSGRWGSRRPGPKVEDESDTTDDRERGSRPVTSHDVTGESVLGCRRLAWGLGRT